MLCAAVTDEMYFNFYFNFLKTPAPSELKTREILENIANKVVSSLPESLTAQERNAGKWNLLKLTNSSISCSRKRGRFQHTGGRG